MALAALRGEKGFSAVLEEAIDVFLEHSGEREKRVRVLAGLAGSLSENEADAMRRSSEEIRSSWR